MSNLTTITGATERMAVPCTRRECAPNAAPSQIDARSTESACPTGGAGASNASTDETLLNAMLWGLLLAACVVL